MKPDTSYADILFKRRKMGNKSCGTLPKEDQKKKDFSRRSGKMKHFFFLSVEILEQKENPYKSVQICFFQHRLRERNQGMQL